MHLFAATTVRGGRMRQGGRGAWRCRQARPVDLHAPGHPSAPSLSSPQTHMPPRRHGWHAVPCAGSAPLHSAVHQRRAAALRRQGRRQRRGQRTAAGVVQRRPAQGAGTRYSTDRQKRSQAALWQVWLHRSLRPWYGAAAWVSCAWCAAVNPSSPSTRIGTLCAAEF